MVIPVGFYAIIRAIYSKDMVCNMAMFRRVDGWAVASGGNPD